MTTTAKSSVSILNGPNLNMLGAREPELYGRETLADIESLVKARGRDLGMEVDFRQSNNEGELVAWIHGAIGDHDAIIINAGAYTHTSVAILDALKICDLPIVEVHLSNIYRREDFRRRSYISEAARGVICGFGSRGYVMALDAVHAIIEADRQGVASHG